MKPNVFFASVFIVAVVAVFFPSLSSAECGGEGQRLCGSIFKPHIKTCDYPWLRPELHPILPVFVCARQWNLAEPDCDCDVEPLAQSDRGPVYGMADTHTHQFSNLAFGGALLWGKPYDERGINAALAWGDFTWDFKTIGLTPFDFPPESEISPKPYRLLGGYPVHFDWGAGVARMLTKEGGFSHGPVLDPSFEGADSFDVWPMWNSTLHQQMYYRWLKRAYMGGLRLMVMHTVNNEAVCLLPIVRKRVVDGASDPTSPVPMPFDCRDMTTVDDQLEAVKAMEKYIGDNDGGWYKIVLSPYEARSAIRDGKMAVVLGIEVDALFGCKDPASCSIEPSLDHYYQEGVRHIVPIHLYNNAFGGAALYNPLFPFTGWLGTGLTMEAEECESVKDGLYGPLSAETAEFNFKVEMDDTLRDVFDLIDDVFDFEPFEIPPVENAHCNPAGLTSVGHDLFDQLMAKKMIIDVDHLSLKALDDVFAKAINRDYPLIASHAYLHERPLTEGGVASTRTEIHRTALQIDIIRELGGVVAPLNPRHEGSSTRDFVHMYQYVVEKMKTSKDDKYPGIAFGTDWGAMYRQTAPRCPNSTSCEKDPPADCAPYDAENCEGLEDGNCLIFGGDEYPIEGCGGRDYPRLSYGDDNDGDGIEDGFKAVGVVGKFRKQRTGSRTFDFNRDGLAHVGLLPDFIKDLTEVGLEDKDLEPLFHSAEAYIRMWEKIHGGPPKITPLITGVEGNNGWYLSDVTVEWKIVSESTIHETDGCDPVTINYDTDGVLLTCWAASDGGEAEASFLVKRDATPPEATCEAFPNTLWPPNGKMVRVKVENSCTDGLSGSDTMLLTMAVSSEPNSGHRQRDRDDDIQQFTIGLPDTVGYLRAERLGNGPGREYTLGYACRDNAGNASLCVTSVFVPHDQGAHHTKSFLIFADGFELDGDKWWSSRKP